MDQYRLVIIWVTYKSETVIIIKGAKQGCPFSPILLNIYVNQPIKEVREILLKIKTGILRFTDDISLLANNEHDLERTLEEITRYF